MPRAPGNIWDHFLIISDNDRKKHVLCNYCNLQYKHAMSNRLKQHLVKCKKCPSDVKKTVISDDYFNRASTSNLLNSTGSRTSNMLMANRTPTTAMTIPESETSLQDAPSRGADNHENIDTALARAIYASGAPLTLLESEYWQDVFKLLDPSYKVPSRHALSDTLLETEYIHIKKDIDNKLHKSTDLTLICDGWTNSSEKGAINFIITTPTPIFYNAIYPTEKVTCDFLSKQIINILNEIGPHKFIAVITDDAANMKAAWKTIETEFPHLSCLGCVSHSLNQIYEEIFKIAFFHQVLDSVVKVIKYVKSTQAMQALFEECQAKKYGRPTCSLKLFSKTQWSGAYNTLQSFKDNREALHLTVRQVSILPRVKTIITDCQLWVKVDEVIKVLQPLAVAINMSEKSTTLLSDLPSIFEILSQNIEREVASATFLSKKDKNSVKTIIHCKKKFCLQPIHYAALQLDPRYCGVCLSDEEIHMVSEYLCQLCAAYNIEEGKLLKNMAEFKLKENFFDEGKAIWAPVNELEPRQWWKTFASNQYVAVIATKILSVPPSSAMSKRNCSHFAQTHMNTKNLLNNLTASKLLSIRSNLNLQKRDYETDISMGKFEDNFDGSENSDDEIYIWVHSDSPM